MGTPTAFVEDQSVFGDLVRSGPFVWEYVHALELIRAKGVRVALHELTRGQRVPAEVHDHCRRKRRPSYEGESASAV